MAIVGPDAHNSSQAPNASMGQPTDPSAKIQEILDAFKKYEIDAFLIDPSNPDNVILSMNQVDNALANYAEERGSPEVYNKWLGLEGKLSKSLKEFRSDLRLLLAEESQMGQAQAMIQDQVPGEGVGTPSAQAEQEAPAPIPAPNPKQGKFGAGERAIPAGEK
jgi:hypothetical protein